MLTKIKINCLPDLVKMNLSSKGYRITKARQKLIEYIANSKEDFFTINEYKKEHKNLNVATFYNNINLLVEANVLGKLKNNDETKYFLKSRSNTIVKCNKCKYEHLIKTNLYQNLKIDDIVQIDALVYVSKCKMCPNVK